MKKPCKKTKDMVHPAKPWFPVFGKHSDFPYLILKPRRYKQLTCKK